MCHPIFTISPLHIVNHVKCLGNRIWMGGNSTTAAKYQTRSINFCTINDATFYIKKKTLKISEKGKMNKKLVLKCCYYFLV